MRKEKILTKRYATSEVENRVAEHLQKMGLVWKS